MNLSKLLEFLVDKPLDERDSRYLVNREEELRYLSSIAIHQPFGIFGVAGETGIGKTTVLNFLNPAGIFVRRVNISLRDSIESILYDLLHSLALSLENVSGVSSPAKKIRKWVANEVASVRGFSLGMSMGVNASFKSERVVKPKFDFFKARENLKELIRKVTKEKGKFLLIIDELDKERKEDVLRVIDSIKGFITLEDFVVVLSLPFSIYREYAADRLRWNESGNLENIFKDIVFLEPLERSEIKEMIIRRLGEHVNLVEMEVFEVVAEFSDGNPRDGLWILTKAVYDHIQEAKLTRKALIETIGRTVGEYMGLTLNLTENQRKAIRILRDSVLSKEKVIASLRENGFKRTTAYSVMDQLLQKRILLSTKEGYRISGKFKYVDI